MGTLISTLENVTEYSSLNGSERLKFDHRDEVLTLILPLEGEVVLAAAPRFKVSYDNSSLPYGNVRFIYFF